MTEMQLDQTYSSLPRYHANRLAVAALLPVHPRLARLCCAAALLLSVNACVTIHEQADAKATAQPVATAVVVPVPDLALTAVEMMNNTVNLRSDRLALMAVVENQGTGTARDIPVRVTVSDDTRQVLLESTQFVDELPAGDTTIVRFEQLTSIPTRSSYELQVEVVPDVEETVTSNNVRTYNVAVDLP